VKPKAEQMNIPEIKQGHGGKRAGAGRPKGTRRKEPTKPIRVPVAILPEIEKMIERHKAKN
jgi:hypothetical protein